MRAQHKLDKGSCRNPVFVIANYAFDTTVQDAFFVKDGVLQEAAASVMSTQEEKDPHDPAVLARASLKFEPRPLKAPYYDDAALNRVLEHYSRRLNNTCFLMPIGALNAIRTLRDFSGGRMFLLSGDKAFQFEEELLSRDEAGLTFHGGSVSMTVNFHALGAYFEEGANVADHPTLRDAAVEVGLDGDQAAEILASRAFADEVAADLEGALDRQITGVPAFVIEDRLLIPGAQEVDTMVALLTRTHERFTPALEVVGDGDGDACAVDDPRC